LANLQTCPTSLRQASRGPWGLRDKQQLTKLWESERAPWKDWKD